MHQRRQSPLASAAAAAEVAETAETTPSARRGGSWGKGGCARPHPASGTPLAAPSSEQTSRDDAGAADSLHGTASRAWRNDNVRYTILYNLLDGACYSVWGALLLPVLISKVCGDVMVGAAAAAAGVAQLLAAAMAGYLGGQAPRVPYIRIGALCGMVSITIFLIAVRAAQPAGGGTGEAEGTHTSSEGVPAGGSADEAPLPAPQSWRLAALLVTAQALWGLCTGFVSTSAEALFADSVASGERTAIYNMKWIVQTLCYVVGYLAALTMLLTLGNDWDLRNVRRVMVVGLMGHPIALATLLRLKDPRPSAPYVLVAVEETNSPPDTETGEPDAVRGRGDVVPLLLGNRSREGEGGAAVTATLASGERLRSAHGGLSASTSPTAEGRGRADGEEGTPQPTRGAGEEVTGEGGAHAGVLGGTAEAPGPQEDGLVAATASAGVDRASGTRMEVAQRRLRAELHARAEHHARRQAARTSAAARALYELGFRLTSWGAVPVLVCLVDFLMALGSGMALLYFPIFFTKDVGVTPVQMYAAYLTSTCLTAVVAHGARLMAERWLDRIPAVMLVRTVGASLLLLMGLIPVHVDGAAANAAAGFATVTSSSPDPHPRRPHAALLYLSLFVGRNALMNAVMGMTRSVIMDAAAKEHRAKWSAFESVSSFTWAGSAMIGGYLVEAKGYQFNFTVTALFHLTAGLLLLPAALGAHRVERVLRECR